MKRFLTISLAVLSVAMMANTAHAQISKAAKMAIAKTEAHVGDIQPITTEAQFRQAVSGPGTASLMISKLAEDKATNPQVKEFAMFETEEQMALGMILKELQTPDVSNDPQVKDAKKQLDATAKGPAFDKAYIQAEIDGHKILLQMTESYLKNGDMNSNDPKEMEARHLAYFMKSAIRQHIVNTTEIMATLK